MVQASLQRRRLSTVSSSLTTKAPAFHTWFKPHYKGAGFLQKPHYKGADFLQFVQASLQWRRLSTVGSSLNTKASAHYNEPHYKGAFFLHEPHFKGAGFLQFSSSLTTKAPAFYSRFKPHYKGAESIFSCFDNDRTLRVFFHALTTIGH